jgi:hypothetical protein
MQASIYAIQQQLYRSVLLWLYVQRFFLQKPAFCNSFNHFFSNIFQWHTFLLVIYAVLCILNYYLSLAYITLFLIL